MDTKSAVAEIIKIADKIKVLPIDTDPEEVRKDTLKLTELFGFLEDQPEAEFFDFTEEDFRVLWKEMMTITSKAAVIELADELDY